jgi:copper chaperone CopZ
MKAGYLTYIFISITTFGMLMASCENDDSNSVKNIEGHWLYVGTKINVSASSGDLKKSAEE